VSRYQKGKTNVDFTEARECVACHQLCHMQVCTSLQTDNHANTPPFIITSQLKEFLLLLISERDASESAVWLYTARPPRASADVHKNVSVVAVAWSPLCCLLRSVRPYWQLHHHCKSVLNCCSTCYLLLSCDEWCD